MRVLLDTNILIGLEDTQRILDSKLADIRRLSSQLHFDLFIHPLQFDDINNDDNAGRRNILLSRVNQYQSIIAPPVLTEEERNALGWAENRPNDRVDNGLLYAVRRNACEILVTNDNGIHGKAKNSNIVDRVLNTEQFLAFLLEQLPDEYISPPDIDIRHLYSINIENEFFDSLRIDYPEFNTWFSNAARGGRQAWCITKEYNRNELGAICIYKDEYNPQIANDMPRLNGKTLKLCTFKIDSEMRGKKLGERLLYVMFNYCIQHNFEYVYIHIWEQKNPLLVSLCEEFGFEKVGTYNERDSVFLKKMQPEPNDQCSPAEYAKKYYPLYKTDASINKFIIPILPKFHEMLFFDIGDNVHGFQFIPNKSSQNTIIKAYICNANIRAIRSGDIILFYRSRDRRSIQSVGVVDDVFVSRSYQDIMAKISKRTALNRIEIQNMLNRDALVIMFRLMQYISPAITSQELEQHGIRSIQTARKLPHNIYEILMRRPL